MIAVANEASHAIPIRRRRVSYGCRHRRHLPARDRYFHPREDDLKHGVRARIAKGTVVHADEAASWDNLHERFEVKRINDQEAYSLDGARTNMAEKYFSRLRRAEIGIHHHIAGSYLLRYAQESSWREDNRRVSHGDQVNGITRRRMKMRGCGRDRTLSNDREQIPGRRRGPPRAGQLMPPAWRAWRSSRSSVASPRSR